MLRSPQLALNGLELIAGHFVNLQDRYRELMTERVEQRIARELLRLAELTGTTLRDTLTLESMAAGASF